VRRRGFSDEPGRTGSSRLFRYRAYDLTIESSFPIRDLPSATGAPDLFVREGAPVVHAVADLDELGHAFASTPEGAWHYHFRDSGSFLVSDGRTVVVEPLPDASSSVVRLSLLGPALGLALMQRGLFVLHASSVALDGRAVAFLGGHAAGKSTLAAALHARGHTMLTDDVAAIRDEAEGPVLLPSFPEFKLWPNALEALGSPPESLPRLHPDLEKRGLPLAERFETRPRPLARLYVLGKGAAVQIEPVTPAEALEQVMRHWYGSRFGRALLQAVGVAAHFQSCARAVASVPVRRLLRPEADSGSASIAEALEAAILRDLGGCSR
jgi:hypothetical protein